MIAKGSNKVWVCLVCGYVHHGDTPPDECAVCGAENSDFEMHVESPVIVPPSLKRWRCTVCGYVHEGDAPPDECPVCGAGPDDFEFAGESASAPKAQSKAGHVVVLGGGIAGVAAAEAVRQASADAKITLISKEQELPYYRLNLTRYLAGEVDDHALPIHPESWYKEKKIRLLQGVEVASLALNDKTVVLRDGSKETFDKLIITCGANPFVPPIPGASLSGVMTLRTHDDARWILDSIKPGSACVCIGGGILGLEIAGGLAKRGVQVTVLEGAGWLLPRQLNESAARALEKHVTALGIAMRFGAETKEIRGAGRVQDVLLADGTILPADLVLIATGVRPDVDLARKAGLTVNMGIVVDSHLTTSQPNVFAAGDVAEHQGTLYGLWEPARYQGTIAGMNAAGVPTEFGGLPRANTLKVLGVEMFSVGVVDSKEDGFVELVEAVGDRYVRFLFRNNVLMGVIFVGDTKLAAAANKAVKTKADFSSVLEKQTSISVLMEFLHSL